MTAYIVPGTPTGTLKAPPSKSMSHRALMAAGLSQGESRVDNLAFSRDIQVTIGAMEALGAKAQTGADWVCLQGVKELRRPLDPIDCGESGSTLRFFIPLASLTGGPVRLLGQGRLMQRPQTVYEELFRSRGLRFEQDAEGITLTGPLCPGEYTLRGDVSSQFITGLLYALPLLPGDSVLHLIAPVESRSYIALTLSALADFGVQASWQDEFTLFIPGGQSYHARPYTVEGDYSQAAFPAVLGAVRGGVTVSGLRADSLQGDRAILDILERCGAALHRQGDAVQLKKAPLQATRIDLADCPDLGPILMVLALFCEGVTRIDNAGRLRLKESDRIEAMQTELARFGGRVECEGDTIYIHGTKLHAPQQPLQGHNDHRVVMALAVCAWAAGLPAQIEGCEAIRKSWPTFFEDMKALNAEVKWENE